MASFGYRSVCALVEAEVAMQLKRSTAGEAEVLNIPIILGGVGLGKTSIARYIAKQLGCDLIHINCGECSDPSEFGMPVPFRIIDKEGEEPYMPWVLNKALHKACTEPSVLFFDDIDKSSALVEGSLLNIFGERSIRNRKLHAETAIIAAGNRVEDDSLARRLSESLRTRGTVIQLEPRLADFSRFAKQNPNKVHPTILGFLTYRPSMLHKPDADADRFPTPRSWVEASAYLFEYKSDHDLLGDKSNEAWRTMITLKCGEAAGHDFHAWFSIVSNINVKKILLTGEVEHGLSGTDAALVDFAAIFAIAQELNNKGPKKEYTGLVTYLKGLHAEHRAALLTQLSARARSRTADLLPASADIMQSDIVPLEE